VGGKERLSLLEEAPTRLRQKLEDRINRLFLFLHAGLFGSTISR
jgi:hypothetical protein